MGDLVTAFPLPPHYYQQRSQEGDGGRGDDGIARIQGMEPPAPPEEGLVCFGVPLKVGPRVAPLRSSFVSLMAGGELVGRRRVRQCT